MILPVKTKIFRLSGGVYSSIILRHLLYQLVGLIILAMFVCLPLGYYVSNSWIYLFFILIFLIYPVILFTSYYLSSTSLEAIESLRPHRIALNDEGIELISYLLSPHLKEKMLTNAGNKSKVTIYNNNEELIVSETTHRYVRNDEIRGIENKKDYMIVTLKGRNRYVIIPFEAVIHYQEIDR